MQEPTDYLKSKLTASITLICQGQNRGYLLYLLSLEVYNIMGIMGQSVL